MASTASWSVNPTVTTRFGSDSTVVEPNSCSMVTGNAPASTVGAPLAVLLDDAPAVEPPDAVGLDPAEPEADPTGIGGVDDAAAADDGAFVPAWLPPASFADDPQAASKVAVTARARAPRTGRRDLNKVSLHLIKGSHTLYIRSGHRHPHSSMAGSGPAQSQVIKQTATSGRGAASSLLLVCIATVHWSSTAAARDVRRIEGL